MWCLQCRFWKYNVLADIFIEIVGNIKEWNRSSTPSLLFLCHSASAIQSSPISCLQCRFKITEHSETFYWCRRKYKRMESKFDTVVAVFCHSASAIQSSPISCLQCRFKITEHSETFYWCRRKYKRMESKFDTVVAVFVSFCIGYPVVSAMMPTMSSLLDVQSTPRRFLDVVGNLK
jgi:hypothetical protein